MKSVSEYWNELESMLKPFPRNNGRLVDGNESTEDLIIKNSWDESTDDLVVLPYICDSVRDAIADFGSDNFHVRSNPEIYLSSDGKKCCYCRLQYIKRKGMVQV